MHLSRVECAFSFEEGAMHQITRPAGMFDMPKHGSDSSASKQLLRVTHGAQTPSAQPANED